MFEAREERRPLGRADLLKAVEKWLADPTKRGAVPVLLRIPNYFEDLAIMVEEGDLELEFVAKGFSALALWEWDYWKEAILLMRVELEDEQTYAEFEKLVNELRALEPEPGSA